MRKNALPMALAGISRHVINCLADAWRATSIPNGLVLHSLLPVKRQWMGFTQLKHAVKCNLLLRKRRVNFVDKETGRR